jgi:alkaline phosphatase D
MGLTGDWDQRISRRTLLKTGGSFAAGITLAGIASGPAFGQAVFPENPFTLGVASGDPSPTGVVLWTRLAPDPLAIGGGMPPEPFEVRYEVSPDEDFHAIVRKGSTVALPDEAHSVREEIHGLGPEHHYFYRFKVGDWISPIGHTRTTPPGNSMVRSLTFAFASCQNYAEGYFTPYDDLAAAQDVEAVIFLGDYIYEGRNRTLRTHLPDNEVRMLDGYRIRHGQYKTDPALQKAHAAHPWLVTWDDHEFDNNYAADDLDPDPAGGVEAVRARRAAAYRAYWEHMPLARHRKPEGPDLRLYRRFTWGQMATFNVLDCRQYRSDQSDACTRDADGYCLEHLESSRTMLGAEQRDWLFEDLAGTKARWNVLAQQSAFAPFNSALAFPPRYADAGADSWEGYVAERQRIIDWAVGHRTPNLVVLTGDTHRNWVRDIPRHYTSLEDPIGTEFLGTSISSNGDPVRREVDLGLPGNPHLRFRKVRQPTSPARTLATFVVENGRPGAQLTGAPPV